MADLSVAYQVKHNHSGAVYNADVTSYYESKPSTFENRSNPHFQMALFTMYGKKLYETQHDARSLLILLRDPDVECWHRVKKYLAKEEKAARP